MPPWWAPAARLLHAPSLESYNSITRTGLACESRVYPCQGWPCASHVPGVLWPGAATPAQHKTCYCLSLQALGSGSSG